MKPPLANALQDAFDRRQLFAPCLGANVTIDDSLHGTRLTGLIASRPSGQSRARHTSRT
jgi:hypothetical protein